MTSLGLISITHAQEASNTANEPPYSVMFYAPGQPNVMGFAQFKDSLEEAVAIAKKQCEENGGENCYPGLAYNKCGAVAELQLGNPAGNPKGWAAADTLRQALDLSVQRCNYFARRIAINRYENDDVYSPRTRTAACAAIFYHCQSWGEADIDASFGVPEDPYKDPTASN